MSVAAARELQLSTVTSDTFIVTFVDDKIRSNIVIKRLLRAVNESATKREEERGSPASVAAQVLTDFARAAYDKGLRTIDWGQIEKKTPQWYHEALPFDYIVRNLDDFIQLDNQNPEIEKVSILETLQDYFRDEFDLVRRVSHSMGKSELMKNIHEELVKEVARKYTFDEVFEHVTPKGRDGKWDFNTLYVFAHSSEISIDSLLEKLETELDGFYKLVSVLVKASTYDEVAKKLHRELVNYFLRAGFSFDDVVKTLKLERGEVDDAKLYTLEMFAQQDMEIRDVHYYWRRNLKYIRNRAFVVSILEYLCR
ncbi:hypothetical protein PsorP6_015020 [Peronosclerospora sorghi]|uniref:Uncharacterized protein n=1 Tax=Peronosclerospora sorghi TaxID=230839 RepID=A0ACC0VUD1_9STRA|nr:hypothetical protein PsorP6_015020 [Peronosclerospora sorghi]